MFFFWGVNLTFSENNMFEKTTTNSPLSDVQQDGPGRSTGVDAAWCSKSASYLWTGALIIEYLVGGWTNPFENY